MVSETPTDGRCNAPAGENNEGYCENYPKKGDDGKPLNGRCRMHGANLTGASEGNDHALMNDGGSPPEGNGNAEKHGMDSDPEKWFERHRDDVEEAVKEKVKELVSKLDITFSDTTEVELITEIAVQMEQMKQGDEYIKEEGFIVTEKKVAGDGSFIKVNTENPALNAKSRLFRDNIRALNKLGVLDSPESQQAEAEEEKVKAWRDALTVLEE